jgi:NTE family protein
MGLFDRKKPTPAEGASPPMEPPAPARPKVGLALGSGVARGWGHIGVLKALHNLGIKPDVIAGSSVGALVAGAYMVSRLDVLEEWARNLTKLRIVRLLDFKVRSGGIVGGEKLVDEMLEHFGDIKIEELPYPFVAVATDLLNGHEVWLRRGSLVDAIRASFSIPGIFRPALVDGRWLIDGALTNPLPISVCRALDCQCVIAVNLTGDMLGKNKAPGSNIPTAAGFDLIPFMSEAGMDERLSMLDPFTKRIFRRDNDKEPSMFGVMTASLGIILDRITRSRLAGDPPDVHIAPRLGHIGLLEFDRADEAIAEGEAAVERAKPWLLDAMQLYNIKPRN